MTELARLSELLSKINADLHNTSKAVVQQLKKDPGSVKEYPFKYWIEALIK